MIKLSKCFSTHTTIFLSSTFLDMRAERDLMRHYVLPLLNQKAYQFGESISICDLRWGIDTTTLSEAETTEKVLSICLDEIENCSPPIVVLLGDRYGWIPGDKAVWNIATKKGLNLLDYAISMTELEIRFSISRGADALYYFKNSNSIQDNHEKLLQLKQEIIKTDRTRVHEYSTNLLVDKSSTSKDSFVNMVLQDLLDYFLPKWEQQNLTAVEISRQKHIQYFEEKSIQFCARETDKEIIIQRLLAEGSLMLQGKSGSGKSTMMGRIANELQEKGFLIIPISCGLTEDSSTAYEVLHLVNSEIIKCLHISINETNDEDKSKLHKEESLFKALWNYAEDQKIHIVVLIDALDQLLDFSEIDDLPFLPKKKNRYACFLASCSSDYKVKSIYSYHLQPMTYEDKQNVVESLLRYYDKELNHDIIETMMVNPMSTNPLYLSMMMQMLLITNVDDYDNIINEQKKTISELPLDVDLLSVKLLDCISKRINPELTKEITCLLACSRYGLRDIDLETILGHEWNYIDFILLINHSQGIFMKRSDGRIDFAHKCLRNGLRKSFDLNEYHKLILDALSRTDVNDPIRKNEYIYHVIKANQKTLFRDFLRSEAMSPTLSMEAARNVYYVCMEDSGRWIVSLLSQINDSYDMLCLFRFLIGALLPLFRETWEETIVALKILDKMTQVLHDERYGEAFRPYRKMMLSMSQRGAIIASSLNDERRTVAYALSLYECGKTLYEIGDLNDRERFETYYNTLIFLKTYGNHPDVKDHFFQIAEEGLQNGAFENGPDEWKGCYWGCIGEVYGRINDFEKQREAYSRDLELRQKAYADNPTNSNNLLLSGAYANIAFSYLVSKNYEDAIRFYRMNLDITERIGHYGDYYFDAVYINIARAYYLLGLQTPKNRFICFLQSSDYKEKDVIINYYKLRKSNVPKSRYDQLLSSYGEHIRALIEGDMTHSAIYALRQVEFEKHIRTAIKENNEDIQPLPTAFTYIGALQNGLPHGKGKMVTPDGYVYIGEFMNGLKEGYGVLTWDHGTSYYKGMWHNDLRDGFGETKTTNSFHYIGEWSKGKINGYGRKENNGDVICGLWKEGNLHQKVSRINVELHIKKEQNKIKKKEKENELSTKTC